MNFSHTYKSNKDGIVLNYGVYLSFKIVLILVNRTDTDEVQDYAAFHLGLHYLPKYPFRGFQYTMG